MEGFCFSNLGMSFTDREAKAGNIEGVFVWFIVVNSLCVVLGRMKGRKDRPEKTF